MALERSGVWAWRIVGVGLFVATLYTGFRWFIAPAFHELAQEIAVEDRDR